MIQQENLSRTIFNIGCGALLVIAVIALAWASYKSPSASVAVRSPDRSDACFMSQKFVREQLKAPSTAEFPDWTENNCNASQVGDKWKVRSFVDAENGFGAMIRSDYGVEMQYNRDRDTWTLLDIQIVNR